MSRILRRSSPSEFSGMEDSEEAAISAGEDEEADRGIFQETRAPEARRKNRRRAPGWTEEKDRRGRRVARRDHRKREEAKRMKETAMVDETRRVDGRARVRRTKDTRVGQFSLKISRRRWPESERARRR